LLSQSVTCSLQWLMSAVTISIACFKTSSCPIKPAFPDLRGAYHKCGLCISSCWLLI
jgi:hypothetical protein